MQIDQRHDELVHTNFVVGHGELLRELYAHIVGVEHGVHRRLGNAGPSEREHIGQRLDADVEVAVEQLHAADGLLGIVEGKPTVLLHHQRAGHILAQKVLAADRARTGATAAMRRGEGLVQVRVDAVEAHVARADDAHDGVEVRAVVVAQSARVVDDLRDLEDVLVENADRVRIREHQSRRVGTDGGAQRVEIDAAIRAGGDVHHLIAAHGGGGGVRSVGGVGHDDLRACGVAAVGVVCLDEQHAGEFAVCARSRLERDRVHAEDLAQLAAQNMQRLERALRRFDRLERVELRETRQRRHVLVDFGVVLHRAGAEGIEAVVHAVDALAKRRVVARQLIFTHMG